MFWHHSKCLAGFNPFQSLSFSVLTTTSNHSSSSQPAKRLRKRNYEELIQKPHIDKKKRQKQLTDLSHVSSRLGVGDGLRAVGIVPADHGSPPSGGGGHSWAKMMSFWNFKSANIGRILLCSTLIEGTTHCRKRIFHIYIH